MDESGEIMEGGGGIMEGRWREGGGMVEGNVIIGKKTNKNI